MDLIALMNFSGKLILCRASINFSCLILSKALLQSKKHMQTGCFVDSARSAILRMAARGSAVLRPLLKAYC